MGDPKGCCVVTPLDNKTAVESSLVDGRGDTKSPRCRELRILIPFRRARDWPMYFKVLIVAFPKAQVLDIAGPLEVFNRVVALRVGQGYSVQLASRAGAISTTSGLTLEPARRLRDIRPGAFNGIDTLMVAGGAGAIEACADAALIKFVQQAAGKVRRIAAVCTGSFILAHAGLLDGRRAATHWSHVAELRTRYPSVRAEEDAIYVRDGEIWTSAGVTAGIDLALAMVRADFGRDTALAIARDLVMFMIRPGGQAQFSSHLIASRCEGGRTAKAVAHILNDLGANLSIPSLAAMLAMSERTFLRVFKAELGITPAVFIDRVRTDAARRMLETDRCALAKTVAAACGFRDEESMRRAFARHLNVTPSQYRARFS